jgi:hypothetical protein
MEAPGTIGLRVDIQRRSRMSFTITPGSPVPARRSSHCDRPVPWHHASFAMKVARFQAVAMLLGINRQLAKDTSRSFKCRKRLLFVTCLDAAHCEINQFKGFSQLLMRRVIA